MFLLWMCFGVCVLAVTATSSSFRASLLGIGGGGNGMGGVDDSAETPEEQYNMNPWQYDSGPQQYGYADPQKCSLFPPTDADDRRGSASSPHGFGLSYRGAWAFLLAALLFILSGLTAPALTMFRICALAPRWATTRCPVSWGPRLLWLLSMIDPLELYLRRVQTAFHFIPPRPFCCAASLRLRIQASVGTVSLLRRPRPGPSRAAHDAVDLAAPPGGWVG